MKLKQRIYRLLLNLKRRTYRLFCVIIACLAAAFGLNPSANADRWYVDGSLQACGDGFGWGTAFRYLQDALAAANGVTEDEIWVRAGTYYVDQSCANEVGTADRTETFQLVKGVLLLGGFDGTETLPEQRDSVANPTFLSGIVADEDPGPACPTPGAISCFVPHPGVASCDDAACCQLVCNLDPICCISGEGNGWDQQCVTKALEICGEAYHVVTAGSEIDDPEQTVIDGFTIRDGWANGSSLLDRHHGGGMFIQGEPSVVRCTFRQNTAFAEGGGMTIKGGLTRPHIINSIFEENPGDPASPGDQQVFPINGGGLASIAQADPIFTNCLFVQNTAKQGGGAIFNSAGPCLANPSHGGSCGRITLINCTVASNTADLVNGGHKGAGLHFGGTAGRLDAENIIVWGNIPEDDQINGALTADFVNYSDIQGEPVWPGTGNINDYPQFVFEPADLRLVETSPCIDAGNQDDSVIPDDIFDLDNDTFTLEPTPDLDLTNRVLDGDDDGEAIVDMGSYEFIHPNVCPCPDICPADLDGSCDVGVKDLLILLGAWGSCPDPPAGCPADLVVDGAVGVKDLLFLLGAWGNCPCGAGPSPPSLQEAVEDAGLTWPDDWDEFEAVMTDPESSQAEKDNYYCWMDHYLNHCEPLVCNTAPCPDNDPFGGHRH